MKKNKGSVFVLSEKGNALTQEGIDMFLSALNMADKTPVFYGSNYNRPDFLAGAVAATEYPYVAIFLDGQVYAIGPDDARQLVAELTQEKNRARSSYKIFLSEIVPNMR